MVKQGYSLSQIDKVRSTIAQKYRLGMQNNEVTINPALNAKLPASLKAEVEAKQVLALSEEEVKKLHFNKLTIFNPGMLERKNSARTGEVLGSRIIKFANKLGLFESQKPLPTSILAQAMINATKIKSNGYSSIKLGNIFSFAEKGK